MHPSWHGKYWTKGWTELVIPEKSLESISRPWNEKKKNKYYGNLETNSIVANMQYAVETDTYEHWLIL